MKRTVLYLLFALLLVGCASQPQTLSELKSEYITIDDSIRVHYKIMNSQADAKTICFVHSFGCDMNTSVRRTAGSIQTTSRRCSACILISTIQN